MPSYETLGVEEIERALLADLRFVGGSLTVATDGGAPLAPDVYDRVLLAARALELRGMLAIAPSRHLPDSRTSFGF
jgi:hypothetical protein